MTPERLAEIGALRAPAVMDELLAEVERLTQQNEGLYQAVLMGSREQARLVGIIAEVASAGVESETRKYVVVQIDWDTWEAAKGLRA